MKHLTSRVTLVAFSVVICSMVLTGLWYGSLTPAAHAAPTKTTANSQHYHVDCSSGNPTCTEVWDSQQVFGANYYVGHDEPSTLFYSNQAGAGNQMRYGLTLPSDPSPSNPLNPNKSFNFQLHIAFWFGMAMCDTQSYPELLSNCTPDSNKNIVDPAISPKHPGTAFTELQFYPPGWAIKPFGTSCDPTKWCAALNIDSLSENPVTGQLQNTTCQGIAGLEPVNFAYITLKGTPQPNSPANPVNSTIQTFTPDPTADLFMNSGDRVIVTLHDSPHGLVTVLQDTTTGQTGSMTASAANSFGQTQFDPTGTSCNNIPYDFHPMYSTSSEKTRVPWAAHTYNIAFADEIGHFDNCSVVDNAGNCTGNEGIVTDSEPADADDTGCLPASSSSLVQIAGCQATNNGFDGASYRPLWPDGNTASHPTSIYYTSPLTGSQYTANYQRMGFEADLPRIEASTGQCDRSSGVGCTLIPNTDDPGLNSGTFEPAQFYPFFSTHSLGGVCNWGLGNHMPSSLNEFHQNQQYGVLLNTTYTTTGGGPTTRYNNFRQVFSNNPCLAGN